MLGSLTAGLLQAQIYENLNGIQGRSGWRWMFTIDGLITLPIAFGALYMVPGTPEKCCSLFLTDDEIRLARRRLKKANIKTPSKDPPPFFEKKLWISVLTSWRIYVLTVLDFLFYNTINTSYSGFALWLKSLKKFSTPTLNRYTSIPPALGILYILLVCGSADILHSRWFALAWGTGNSILAYWEVPDSAKWFSFLIAHFSISISSVVYAWVNDIMRHNAQERAIVVCWCNIFSMQSITWTMRLVFPTTTAPRYHKGYSYCSIISGFLFVWIFVTLWFYKRQERIDAKANGIILYNSKTGVIPPEASEYWNKQKSSSTPSLHKENYQVQVCSKPN